MSRFHSYAAVLIAAMLGGCASAPEQISTSAEQGAPEQISENATEGATEADVGAIAAGSADLEPVVVELDARDHDPGLVVSCRDMLQTASNTLVTRCMTRDDWKRFEEVEARQAQEMVRRMQGDPFP